MDVKNKQVVDIPLSAESKKQLVARQQDRSSSNKEDQINNVLNEQT